MQFWEGNATLQEQEVKTRENKSLQRYKRQVLAFYHKYKMIY